MTSKNLFKKLSVLALAFVMIFALAACDNGTTDDNVDVATYSVTFTVTGPSEATVTLNGEEKATTNGTVEFTEFEDGEYDYTVTAEGYQDVSDTVVVDGADQTVTVEMEEETAAGGTITTVSAVNATEVSVEYGTSLEDAKTALEAVEFEGAVEEGDPVTLTVDEWTSADYDGETADSYTFEGDVVAPEGYAFAEGLDTAVTATVTVNEFVPTFNLEPQYEEGETSVEVASDTDQGSVDIILNIDLEDLGEYLGTDTLETSFDFEAGEIGDISQTETTQDGEITVKLTVYDITEERTASVTATLTEIKDYTTGERYEQLVDRVNPVNIKVNFEPAKDGDDTAGSVSLGINKAIANNADRIHVDLGEKLSEDTAEDLEANPKWFKVTDNHTTTSSTALTVKKVVAEEGSSEVLLVLGVLNSDGYNPGETNFSMYVVGAPVESNAIRPLTDNVEHKVAWSQNFATGSNANYSLQGSDEFKLEDKDYLELINVTTGYKNYTAYDEDTNEEVDLEDNQIAVVFNQAVNNLSEKETNFVDEKVYSVRNLTNWVIDGRNLGTNAPSMQNNFVSADSTSGIAIDVYSSSKEELTRDVVYITFEDDEYLNVNEFLDEGTHSLQVSNIGDWASLTDDVNVIDNLSYEYEGVDAGPTVIQGDWIKDSPEQFVVEQFNGELVSGSALTFTVPDAFTFTAAYDGSNWNVDDVTTPESIQLDEYGLNVGEKPFTITTLADDTNLLIELNQDWTQAYDTDATGNNYHMSDFNDVTLEITDLVNNFGDPVEVNFDPKTLNEDDVSPDLVKGEVLKNTYSETFEFEAAATDYSLDSSDLITERGYGPEYSKTENVGAVLLTFDEPIQFKDGYGPVTNSAVSLTPGQQQVNEEVPEISFEYVNQDNSEDTIEGRILKIVSDSDDGVAEAERDFSAIVVPVSQLALNANYKLVVRNVTDDIGNSAQTFRIAEGTEETKQDLYIEQESKDQDEPADLRVAAIDAHAKGSGDPGSDYLEGSEDKDIVHVLFNKEMALTGVDSPLRRANWRLNGEPLPAETTRIERGLRGVDFFENSKKAVTIILPAGYLQERNNNHIVGIIDVEAAEGDYEPLNKRIQIPYYDSDYYGGFTDMHGDLEITSYSAVTFNTDVAEELGIDISLGSNVTNGSELLSGEHFVEVGFTTNSALDFRGNVDFDDDAKATINITDLESGSDNVSVTVSGIGITTSAVTIKAVE